ncbi:MAG: hypothetical protein ACK5LK_03455 [Chthoniobacterales bacterium]
MQANDLFSKLSKTQRSAIFDDLYEKERETYRAVMSVLSTRRKLRPVFLERKPRPERNQWMAEMLSRILNNDLAAEVLQNWLLKCHEPMILSFLNKLNIPHDGHGLIEETPNESDPALLEEAVQELQAKYPEWLVATYLNLFIEMAPDAWPTLSKLLINDPKLALNDAN